MIAALMAAFSLVTPKPVQEAHDSMSILSSVATDIGVSILAMVCQPWPAHSVNFRALDGKRCKQRHGAGMASWQYNAAGAWIFRSREGQITETRILRIDKGRLAYDDHFGLYVIFAASYAASY
ncbi:hypothetical protein ACFIOY_39965 [Bradyrhizobium sp. TZ2]